MNNSYSHADEHHYFSRSNWLRAAVLGANDGIISISALIIGVAAASPTPTAVFIAGISGLASGALSMAAGEYVSVSSQLDIEKADILKEKEALEKAPEAEFKELVAIYKSRGLTESTATIVAQELTQHDALAAHVRDEIGISEVLDTNPIQAAIASGLTFSCAGLIPLLTAILSSSLYLIPIVIVVTIIALAMLGIFGAITGGAKLAPAVLRVVSWGIFSMTITFGIGHFSGVAFS